MAHSGGLSFVPFSWCKSVFDGWVMFQYLARWPSSCVANSYLWNLGVKVSKPRSITSHSSLITGICYVHGDIFQCHMYTYIHTCMHACMYACIHIYTHTHIHIYTYTYMHTYIHTYLLLISMLWHRQAIFKSKGDKLCSSAECRIWTRGPRHQIASRLNAHWQTDWAIEDQAKNLNSTSRPYDQWAFSPLDPTVSWLSHLALAIYIFVVVNFDALAQASDIQIERRQIVLVCWMQDLNPGFQTPNRQQTECSLIKRLSYRGSS